MSRPTRRQQPKFPKNDPLAPLDQNNDTLLVIDETPPPSGALFAGCIPRKPKPGPSVVEQIIGAVVEDVEMKDPKPEDQESEEEEFVYRPREVIKELGKFAREGKICGEYLTWRLDRMLGDILEEKDPDQRAYELESAVQELMNKPLPASVLQLTILILKKRKKRWTRRKRTIVSGIKFSTILEMRLMVIICWRCSSTMHSFVAVFSKPKSIIASPSTL
jgi:hypothetical protein